MHFAKTEKGQTKLSRAFALLISMMIVLSMVVVGGDSVSAYSDPDNPAPSAYGGIYAGRLYFDFSQSNWYRDGAKVRVYHWVRKVTDSGRYDSLTHLTGDIYYIDLRANTNGFKLLRFNNTSGIPESGTGYPSSYGSTLWNSSNDCAFGGDDSTRKTGQDVFKPTSMSSLSGKSNCIWYKYSSPASTNYGTKLTAKNGFADNTSVVGVPAVFYDYYTDYERTYHWHSIVENKNGEQASRIYANSFPFDQLNSYISNIANSNSWEIPLYFGNFYTEDENSASDHAFAYGYSGNIGFTRSTQNYSPPIKKFSNQANNSMYLNAGTYAPDGDYSKYSIAGLANNELVNDKLTMGTGNVTAPYFDDAIVDAGYATKITTEFPMKVVDHGNFKTYLYDSNNTFGEGTDNAFFSGYGTSDFKMNYRTGEGATDAHYGFGADNDGTGFFPFEENGEGVAYDYGFGMRLDIPFNMTADGKIPGTNDDIMFRFCGDDDVWVYIDGKLALDLGGDHQKAKGEINFGQEKAIVETGIYTILSNNNYGNPVNHSYGTPRFNQSSANVSNVEVDLSSVIDKSDPTAIHTLTVFYMERGMSESNLSMEFTITPATNKLLTTKTVNTDGVNDTIANSDEFKTAIANEEFGVTYTENDSLVNHKYTIGESTDENTLASGKADLKAGSENMLSFSDQFTTNNTVKIVEDKDDCNYQYTTTVAVTDEYLKAAKENVTNVTNGAQFTFKTDSTKTNAPTIIKAAFTNAVKTGKVKIAKNYSGTNTGDYTFKVEAKVPGSTAYINLGNVTVSAGNESTYIEGIPLGSEVIVTETSTLTGMKAPTFTLSGTSTTTGTQPGSGVNFKLNADTTVTCTNSDKDPANVTIDVYKTVNGHDPESGESFQFKMTEVNSSGNALSGVVAATKNTGSSNKAQFDIEINSAGTRYFKIEEVNISSPYTLDTAVASCYFVKIESTETDTSYASAITRYKNAIDSNQLSATDKITFNNTKPTKGSIVFKKAAPNGDGLKGAQFGLYKKMMYGSDGIAITTSDSNGDTVVTHVEIKGDPYKTATSDGNGIVTFTDVEPGEYFIMETKAPANFELYGEVIGEMTIEDGKTIISHYKPIEVKAGIKTYGENYTLKNIKSTDLPQTGGVGVVVMIVGGLALIALGVYLLKTDKKDEESK